jgi:hypothetical protein
MGFVLLTHGRLEPLVSAIAGNSQLLAFGVLAPLNLIFEQRHIQIEKILTNQKVRVQKLGAYSRVMWVKVPETLPDTCS